MKSKQNKALCCVIAATMVFVAGISGCGKTSAENPAPSETTATSAKLNLETVKAITPPDSTKVVNDAENIGVSMSNKKSSMQNADELVSYMAGFNDSSSITITYAESTDTACAGDVYMSLTGAAKQQLGHTVYVKTGTVEDGGCFAIITNSQGGYGYVCTIGTKTIGAIAFNEDDAGTIKSILNGYGYITETQQQPVEVNTTAN